MANLVMIYSKDPDFYMLMSHILATSGFDSLPVDGLEAVLAAPLPTIVAILVDTSDGIDRPTRFCAETKANSLTRHLPIAALIPARHEHSYLQLLKAGIDEGFTRPISPERVLNYLHGLARTRRKPDLPATLTEDIRQFGDLHIDPQTRLVRSEHGSTHLSPIKFSLLRRLLKTPGHVVSRAELIEAAWPDRGHVSARTVDVHIANLRRDIATTIGHTSIRTVRSSGYVLVVGAAPANDRFFEQT
jgi:two-component system phosphate regulon response regulator PhoB